MCENFLSESCSHYEIGFILERGAYTDGRGERVKVRGGDMYRRLEQFAAHGLRPKYSHPLMIPSQDKALPPHLPDTRVLLAPSLIATMELVFYGDDRLLRCKSAAFFLDEAK